MAELLKIKNKTFGNARPLICVPVMAQTKAEIVQEIRRLSEEKVDIIEWRVDAFEGIRSLNAIREVLEELVPFLEESILLFTFRSKEQGGLISMSAEEIYDLHQVAAESKVVDLIDVEYFQTENIDKEIRTLQKMGAKIVTSHHDFYETPSAEVIGMLLEQMKHSRADIVKLAVMPKTTEDVIRLLEETSRFHKRYPKQPLITMSMGKMGCISRVSGAISGSCVTFAAGKKASAPGQIPYEELKNILSYMGEEDEK